MRRTINNAATFVGNCELPVSPSLHHIIPFSDGFYRTEALKLQDSTFKDWKTTD